MCRKQNLGKLEETGFIYLDVLLNIWKITLYFEDESFPSYRWEI